MKILNVIDDHSRLLVASTAMAACTGSAALTVVAHAAATLGWPQRFQSDNASTFRHVLADALRPPGVAAAHSRPNHPQTNGKVERFQQTVQKWLAAKESVATIEDLQALLDLFRQPERLLRQRHGRELQQPLQWELIYPQGPWRGLDDVEFATLGYIDWFDHRRLHGEITVDDTYVTPAEFEAAFYRQTTPAPEPVTQ